MTSEGWNEIRSVVDETVYDLLFERTGTGPFDGCCVVVAEAMRQVFGGEIVVFVRSDGVADHAALRLEGVIADFDGPVGEEMAVADYNEREYGSTVSWRPIRDDDLEDAFREADLCAKLAETIRNAAEAANACRRGV